jgi:nitrite reductase/ring-hydroxylating ferredoxin subunit
LLVPEQPIATEAEISEGKVVTFGYRQDGIRREGILLRTSGGLRCYENLCRHLPVKLDLGNKHFLSREKKLILCQSHGAVYEPETGLCTRGPCEGASLKALPFEIREGKVYLLVTDETD